VIVHVTVCRQLGETKIGHLGHWVVREIVELGGRPVFLFLSTKKYWKSQEIGLKPGQSDSLFSGLISQCTMYELSNRLPNLSRYSNGPVSIVFAASISPLKICHKKGSGRYRLSTSNEFIGLKAQTHPQALYLMRNRSRSPVQNVNFTRQTRLVFHLP
jgi:hypothetical protein